MSRVILASSGLGPHFGGIGVVAEQMRNALLSKHRVDLWMHPSLMSRWNRRLRFLARGAELSLGQIDAVIYEHLDLAKAHSFLSWRKRIPYVVFVHGTEIWRPLEDAKRRVLESADLVLTNSENTVKLAQKENPQIAARARVVHLGVDIPDAVPANPRRLPVAMIVGRMHATERQKGHDLALDAWPLVTRAVPNAELWIVGEGNDVARLQQRATDEKLNGVRFLGYVEDAQLRELMQKARIFLFPSVQEGFGLAAAEAAGYGMAIVGIQGTVLEEVLGETAKLVGERTATAIAEGCIALLKNDSEAFNLGTKASTRVRERFLARHFEARFLVAMAPLLAGAHNGTSSNLGRPGNSA